MANDAVRCEPLALIYQYVGDRTPNRSPALKQMIPEIRTVATLIRRLAE